MSCFFLEVAPNRNSNLAPGSVWARARRILSSGGRWKLVYLEIGHVSVDGPWTFRRYVFLFVSPVLFMWSAPGVPVNCPLNPDPRDTTSST